MVGSPGPDRACRSRARGLTRAERKELTRELLFDAAIEVFARKGYHGASLDDVAEAAGFTKGAVYSNFTRKSDLFRALLERESQRRGEGLRRRSSRRSPLALLPEVAGGVAPPPGRRVSGTGTCSTWSSAGRRARPGPAAGPAAAGG